MVWRWIKSGKVKIDINKAEREFELLTLSDINVVQYLIRFRDKIDIYYDNDVDNYYHHAGNVQKINQELITLYASLDETIKMCNFSEEEKAIIKLMETGFTFGGIASYFEGVTGEQIKRRFNAVCKKIVNKNKELWSINIIFNYIKSDWKTCSKCGDILPMNDRFFSPDNYQGGFMRYCKNCR